MKAGINKIAQKITTPKSGSRALFPPFRASHNCTGRGLDSSKFEPLVPQNLEEKIVERYVEMRQQERHEQKDERKDYSTPRQLLGMIRLSQALARIRFSDVVSEGDWEEALRLFGELRHRDEPSVISYSAAISACSNGARWVCAFRIVREVPVFWVGS